MLDSGCGSVSRVLSLNNTGPNPFQQKRVYPTINGHYQRLSWAVLWVESQTVWPNEIAKCLQKLPKNDLTRKMKDVDTFTKIA